MQQAAAFSRHLRPRDGTGQPTTSLELFFDLVYVFAVTQLSHLLIDHLDVAGAAHVAFLLLVVWWAWIYTTWMVNWFDPASGKVRLVLSGGTLASLLIAAPKHALTTAGMIMTVGGPALYLTGENVFRLRMIHSLSRKRIVAVAALALFGALAGSLSALAVSLGVAALLTALAIWEYPRAPRAVTGRLGERAP